MRKAVLKAFIAFYSQRFCRGFWVAAGGFTCPPAVFEKKLKKTNTDQYKKIKGYAFPRELSQTEKNRIEKDLTSFAEYGIMVAYAGF